jgi:hypothetical protein
MAVRTLRLSSAVVVLTLCIAAAFARGDAVFAQTAPAPQASPPADPCTGIAAYVTRPSVTNSACTVAPGDILIENGYQNQTNVGTGAGNLATYPQTYVRLGTAPRIEIDVLPPTVEVQTSGGPAVSGLSDVGIGARYTFGHRSAFVYGLNVALTEPSGDPAFTAHGPTYTASANFSFAVTSRVSLFSSLILNSLSTLDANGRVVSFGSFTPTLNATYALTSSTTALAEVSQTSAVSPGLGPRRQLLYGFQQTAGPHVMLDAEAANNWNALAGARYHYVGLGFSYLFGT